MKLPPWTLVTLSLALGATFPLFADEATTTKPAPPPAAAPATPCPYAAEHAQLREKMLAMHQQMLEAKGAQTRNRLMSQQMALMHEAMANMHGGRGPGPQGMGPGMMGAGQGRGAGMGPGMMGPGSNECMAERMAMMETMMQMMVGRMEPPPGKKK